MIAPLTSPVTAVSDANASDVVVVVIGRNEGERLRRCFSSLSGELDRLIYVDSGSTDGSVALALALGIDVVVLDASEPFTAARARNAGVARWIDGGRAVRFVQFIDGDCEVIDGWLASAASFLAAQPEVACVCGRLRERHPEHSLYNRLCEAEWDRPAGPIAACGGIALFRGDAFIAAGGFREDLVAGEEPELCLRLRERGWQLWRLALPMATHDAAILQFRQWWLRSKRNGFGCAQAIALRGRTSERVEWCRLLRPWFWLWLPLLATVAAVFMWGAAGGLVLLVYVAQALRQAHRAQGSPRDRLTFGFFLTLGKLPEWFGQWQFWRSSRLGRAASVRFDYKSR